MCFECALVFFLLYCALQVFSVKLNKLCLHLINLNLSINININLSHNVVSLISFDANSKSSVKWKEKRRKINL